MKVENWEIDKVHPYQDNPRFNDDAVEPVAKSLQKFGWAQPLVVDAEGVIIVGHTRYKAAKKLGLKQVPVVVADKLSAEQVKAYRIADNKTGELSSWDFSKLKLEEDDINKVDRSFLQEDLIVDLNDSINDEPLQDLDNDLLDDFERPKKFKLVLSADDPDTLEQVKNEVALDLQEHKVKIRKKGF